MAVERCPSCRAKYDVSRLERGGEFACRRCGKPVTVGAATTARQKRARPALLVTGVVMILGLFLYANPAFGSKSAKWPWQHFIEANSLSRKADLLLWVVVGTLAIAFGTGRGGRNRMAWLMAPLLLLATRCYGQGAAFTAVRSNEPALGWFAAVTCMGAAGLVLGSRAAEGRAGARTLAWVGALGMTTAYAVTFGPTGHSLLWHYGREFTQTWDALFQGGEAEPGTVSALWMQWWGKLLPMALQILAGLFAVALAVVPATRRGAIVRCLGWGAFGLLVARWMEPLVATFYYERSALATGGLSNWALLVGRTLFDSGLGLWLIASCTLAALVMDYGEAVGETRAPQSRGAAVPSPMEGGS